MIDNIKALNRLETTKDYLKELYREQVKNCPYPELKPIAKQTYEDNKMAFNIAIKAIKESNRQQAEIFKLQAKNEALEMDNKQLDCDVFNALMNLEAAQAEIEKLELLNASLTDSCDGYIKAVNIYRAEIERLKGWQDLLKAEKHSLIKAEAVKEFAERLCKDRVSNDPVVIAVKVELKEMGVMVDEH